jgi:hypothetical protein
MSNFEGVSTLDSEGTKKGWDAQVSIEDVICLDM